VAFGLGGRDRIRAKAVTTCLLGGNGDDELRGQQGSDRLTGGRGGDVLAGGPEVNAYDAGPAGDVVNARSRSSEPVRCGSGRDRARVDRGDRTRSCERISHPR
jgi:Ca2+-binding RTX toxin-like protein